MEYAKVFCGLSEPFDLKQAQIEASRCYYCYDAPCVQACPTEIDIPSFIRKISNDNIRGAALDILQANIMGGTCARACPVETLCQQACVREHSEAKPVQIGHLQRFATDQFFETGEQPFRRAPRNGKKVAVVGAGPAGLSCAHKLALLGYEVSVFEAREKSGGLNEYGLAPYKMTDDFAQKEIEFILSVGGIEIQHGKVLGKNLDLAALRKSYQAVFLAVGLGSTNKLGLEHEDAPGVIDAVKHIALIRQTKDLTRLEVGRHVVVIGGGNTAIDIAIQMKKQGSEFVTIVYRRGQESMSATRHEQELAQTHGVVIRTWLKPIKIELRGTHVAGLELEYTRVDASGKLLSTGQTLRLPADQVFKAIGQALNPGVLKVDEKPLELSGGKLKVQQNFETSIAGVFAGGDCVGLGEDLTVTAVQHGKLAALAIHEKLGGNANG